MLTKIQRIPAISKGYQKLIEKLGMNEANVTSQEVPEFLIDSAGYLDVTEYC
jgi:hypothetical protein